MIRNIVFDMGEVLLKYNPLLPCIRHTGNLQDAQKIMQVCFNTKDWIKLDGGFLSEDEILAIAKERLADPRLGQKAEEIMVDWHLDALWPKEGMKEVIEDLLSRGFKLYILSNAGLRFRDFQYKIPHVDEFSGILVSAEEKMLKPSLEIFERLCEKFDIKAEECLFIDDLQKNVDGAQAANMQGYCFADGDVAKLREFLQSM